MQLQGKKVSGYRSGQAPLRTIPTALRPVTLWAAVTLPLNDRARQRSTPGAI